ncbi:MAG: cytidine deaminase [Ignavibacteriales bacterium]|nr:cytidine deaminase [Ignavibacteriales bacterium]
MENKIIKQLIREAEEAKKNSYSPYSNFRVGASLITKDGRIFRGTNVENASYGLAVCAERNAIFTAVGLGYRTFDAIAIGSDLNDYTAPCGACRQVINEFADSNTKIILYKSEADYKIYNISELLPFSFGPEALGK